MIFRVLIPLLFSILFYFGLKYVDKTSKTKRIEIVYVEVKCKVKLTKKQSAALIKKLNLYYAGIFFIAALVAYNVESLILFAAIDLVIIVVGLLLSTRWLRFYGNKLKARKKKTSSAKTTTKKATPSKKITTSKKPAAAKSAKKASATKKAPPNKTSIKKKAQTTKKSKK